MKRNASAVIKHAVPLFLALVTLLLSSCGIVSSVDVNDRPNDKADSSFTAKDIDIPNTPTPKPGDAADYTAEELLAELPEDDFAQMYFTVITIEEKNLMFPEEDVYIASSVYERNRKVEGKYNIKFYENAMGENELFGYLESEELAGGYYADLLDLPYSYMPLLYEKGLIQNFRTKPFFVEDRPYFDADITESLNAGYGGLYALYSDALYSPDDMYCVFYNRALEGASVIEGGKIDAGLALFYGLVCDKELPEELEALRTGEDMSLFTDGKALMCIDRIKAIETLSGNMSVGIMSLPFDDGDKSAYMPAGDLQVFFYPTNAASDKCTCLVASALGAAGYGKNINAAKGHYMSYVQDNASALMLEKIFEKYRVRGI